MPSWFALGSDVYRLRDAHAIQGDALALDPYPRWFSGVPRQVSAAEFERRRAARGDVLLEARDTAEPGASGQHWIATSPPLPARLGELALVSHGARLELDARVLQPSGDVELRIVLRAEERTVWREAEHRSTNVFPFLVGLFVDGRPVRMPSSGCAKFGGISRFEKLVESGEARAWVVRIQRSSIRSILGTEHPARLGLVAALSERQHGCMALETGVRAYPDLLLDPPFGDQQILVRSRVDTVAWPR